MSNATIISYGDYIKPNPIPGHGIDVDNYPWQILSEGDSWFNFNRFAPEENLLQHLNFKKDTVIVNVALSGDTIQDILEKKRFRFFRDALKSRKWSMILFSAGGNDLIDAFCGDYHIGGEVIKILKSATSKDFMDYIDDAAMDKLLANIQTSYEKVAKLRVSLAKGINSQTPIVLHCYDYFTIRNGSENISKRCKALKKQHVPVDLWEPISKYMVDRLAKALFELHDPSNHFYVVDTCRTLISADANVIGDSKDWRNEIHPNHGGYQKLADQRVSPVLNKLLP